MSTQKPISNQPEETGFTLVELLVAFTVATLLVGAIYAIFSTGLRSSLVTQHTREAILLAESSLDTLSGMPIQAQENRDHIGPYERQIYIRPRLDLTPPDARLGVIPYELEVQISWRDGSAPHNISLSTLWLGSQ